MVVWSLTYRTYSYRVPDTVEVKYIDRNLPFTEGKADKKIKVMYHGKYLKKVI